MLTAMSGHKLTVTLVIAPRYAALSRSDSLFDGAQVPFYHRPVVQAGFERSSPSRTKREPETGSPS